LYLLAGHFNRDFLDSFSPPTAAGLSDDSTADPTSSGDTLQWP